MKRPYPQPAADAPAGTVWTGGPIPWFSISLSITADDLDPDEVTRLLGVEPDRAQQKGIWLPTKNGQGRTPKFGRWAIELLRKDTSEWDVEVAIGMVLDRVTSSTQAWRQARANTRARMFVGLTLDSSNRGFGLRPELMRRLADFDLELDFDVYNEQTDAA